MARKRKMWQSPSDTNVVLGHENRKVSWLELFFDIFFVCAIASVGHILVDDMSWKGVQDFVMVFVPVWWIWLGFTFYNERFESFGLENRVFTFLMMIAVAGMAIFAHHATSSTFTGFGMAYLGGRMLLGFLYGRAAAHIDNFRIEGRVYAACFFFSGLLLLINIWFVPDPLRVDLFGAILLFDLFIPFIANIFTGKLKNNDFLDLSEKIDERFGLFSIIVLGELVVSVINGLSKTKHPSLELLSTGIIALAVGLFMWWLYFDFIGRRGTDKTARRAFAWAYLHMPLVMCFVSLSAGLLYAFKHPEHFADYNRYIIGFSAGLAIILTGIVEYFSFRHEHEPTDPIKSGLLKALSGGLLITITLISTLELREFLICVLLTQMIPIAYGLYIWFTQPEESAYETKYIG